MRTSICSHFPVFRNHNPFLLSAGDKSCQRLAEKHLLELPVEIARDLLQVWLTAKVWVTLDSAYCNKLERSAFLDVMVGITYIPSELRFDKYVKADLEFVWCASRQIRMLEIDILAVSDQPLDVLQFKSSATTSSLVRVAHHLWNHVDWGLRLISISPNIQRLCIENVPRDQVSKLNEWCPQLTALALNFSKPRQSYPYLLSSFAALKKLRIYNTMIESLRLPQQLEEFSFEGYVDESTLLFAFASCKKLTKVGMQHYGWSTNFPPSSRVFQMLPPSLTSLKFQGCSELSFVLHRFTLLTALTIVRCHEISQEGFDGLFRLPAITYLALECRNAGGVPKIQKLSDGIECPTLKYLTMEAFESIQDDAMTSIVQRCPGLTYISIVFMVQIKADFTHLNDRGGSWNFANGTY